MPILASTIIAALSLAGTAAQGGSQLLAAKKAKQEEQVNQFNNTMQSGMANYNNMKPMYQFNQGGMVPGAVPITVEGQEVIKTPGGATSKVAGPSHEQGGVDMNVPAGTQVFSNDLKNPKTGNTFAKDAELLEKQLKKYKGKSSGTSIDSNTKARMLKNLQAQLDELFNMQQELNGNNQGTFGNDGLLAGNPLTNQYGLYVTPGAKYVPPASYTLPASANISQRYGSGYNPANLFPSYDFSKTPASSTPSTTPEPVTAGGGALPWINAASTLGGTIFNIAQGMGGTDTVPNYNQYEGAALQAMKDRSYNISPILASNRASQAVNNRNITNAANSAGAMMGNYTAAQNARSMADANAWATKQNADNSYMGEYAQLLNNAGQNRAAMDWQVQTANEQNKAARMQHFGQGFADIGEYAQMQQLMRNQAGADTQRMGIYQDLYKTIMPFMQNSGGMTPNYADLMSKIFTSKN